MKNNSNQTAKFKTLDQISAGGVAFRETDAGFEIALIAVGVDRRWQLPKGIVEPNESTEVAAQREVSEESGIQTEVLAPIEKIEYWYFGDYRGERVRFHKLVHFFLMTFRGGAVENHDSEVVEARWIEAQEAIEMLAFKSEKSVVEKALQLIPQFSKKIV